MPFNPLNNSEVRLIFPLILRVGKWGVTEVETGPKSVTPELASFLSTGRGTETFLRVQVRERKPRAVRGQPTTRVSSRTGPRVAFRFLHDPLSILIPVGSQWPWCSFSVWRVCNSLPYIWSWGQETYLLWVKVLLLELWRFFSQRKPVCSLHKQSPRPEMSVNWFTTS